jgi:hypothetical protein
MVALTAVAIACGGSDGGGGGLSLEQVDQACREFCANGGQGPDCGPKGSQSVEACYDQCVTGYANQVTPECFEGLDACYEGPVCPDEWWAANYGCFLSVDCNDQFGDCDDTGAAFSECYQAHEDASPAWCEANCPDDPFCPATVIGFPGGRVCGAMLPGLN